MLTGSYVGSVVAYILAYDKILINTSTMICLKVVSTLKILKNLYFLVIFVLAWFRIKEKVEVKSTLSFLAPSFGEKINEPFYLEKV